MSLVANEIAGSTAAVRAAPAHRAGDLAPGDRVTLSADARDANGGTWTPPRSDVRWYRPHGTAAVRYGRSLQVRFAAGAANEPVRSRRHAGVEAYLRTRRDLDH